MATPKGYKFSKEHNKKMSLSLLGNTNGFKKGLVPWNKGKHWSKEIKNKLIKAASVPKPWLRGKKRSLEARKNMSINHADFSKEKSHFWKGGITPKNKAIRTSMKYKLWRKVVFERDKFTCQNCGKVGGDLNAHHIKAMSEYPDLTFDINNGVTLCISCHRLLDKYLQRRDKFR